MRRNLLLLLVLCLCIYNSNGQTLDHSFGKNGILTVVAGNKINVLAENIYKIFPLNNGQSIVVIQADNFVILSRRLPDGTIDKSYGDSGYSQAVKIMQPAAAAMQNDGKIVVTGQSDFSNTDFIVARFTTNGNLDAGFGVNGVQFTDLGSSADISNCIAIDHSGKILLGGSTLLNGNAAFAIVRYNTDGTLDASFNGNGKVITDFGTYSVIRSLAIQDNNTIIAAGISGSNGLVIRYNNQGIVDPVFTSSDQSSVLNEFSIYLVTLQTDGKIVLGGNSSFSYISNIKVARLNNDGSIDNSFNGTGQIVTDFGFQNNFFYDLKIDDQNKIVACGSSYNGGEQDYAFARYNEDGTYDLSFNGSGIAIVDAGSQSESPKSIAFQNGKILAGGQGNFNYNYDYSMVRLNYDGSYDLSFGTSGKLIDYVPAYNSGLNDFTRLSSGKLLIAGSNLISSFPFVINNFLKEFKANGNDDNSYGDNGLIKVNGTYTANLNNGKTIVAGYKTINQSVDFYIESFLPNGKPDMSFGTNGAVSTDFGGDDYPIGILVQQDGKFIVGGFYYSNSGSNVLMARYNPDGSLDATFGQNGIVITDINNSDDYPNSMSIQKDGKPIMAGYFWLNGEGHIFLVRYNTDGSIDPSFGTQGKSIFNFSQLDNTNTVVSESDGTIVFSGASFPDYSLPYVPFLMHLKSNGTPDSSFGADGKIIIDASSIAVQKNKKIIIGGRYYDKNVSGIQLVRLNTNGSVDNSFGYNGTVKTKVTNGDDILTKLKLYNSDLYVSGYSITPDFTAFLALYTIDNPEENDDNKKIGNPLIVNVNPNPSSSVFRLQISNAENSGKISLRVVDEMGRIVEIRFVNSGETITIGDNYKSGTYFIQVMQNDQIQTLKIVKI